MSVIIKALKQGQIPSSGDLTLYTAPTASPGPARATIVKNMRFVNTGSSSVTLNVWFKRGTDTERRVLPKDLSIAPGQLVIDNDELTLESGDTIRGQASAATTVDYVFSGVERDAS